MTATGAGHLRDGRLTLDSRSWLELVGAFLLLSVLFALLCIDLVSTIAEDPGFSVGTLVSGGAIGAGIALGLTVLLLLRWQQDGGRVRQRLGRQAWQERRLPDDETARRLAIADLRRRERADSGGIASLLLASFWVFIGVLQIMGSGTPLHAIAWLLLIAVPGAITIRSVLDRRRLPQLRALLEQANSAKTTE